jgi:hypothetical protein
MTNIAEKTIPNPLLEVNPDDFEAFLDSRIPLQIQCPLCGNSDFTYLGAKQNSKSCVVDTTVIQMACNNCGHIDSFYGKTFEDWKLED